MTKTTTAVAPLKVGDRVRWASGKRSRLFGENERGTVIAPPRRISGDTIYVEWDNHGVLPVSQRALERV